MCSKPIDIPKSKNAHRGSSASFTEGYVPRNVETINVVAHRLKSAALFAKTELSHSKNIQSAIPILDHKLCSIVVNELKKDGVVYLVVYKNEGGGNSKTLFKEMKDRWRYIFFKNLYGARIFINCKLLKIMFEECEDCVISLRSPVIGSCEFLRCKDINLNIRIAAVSPFEEEGEECLPIPYTRIELCSDFNIMQSNSILIYIVKSSHYITGNIVDQSTGIRRAQHELGGSNMWNEDEQAIISFSKKEGFVSVPYTHALNDISQHIIIKPLQSLDDDVFEDLIGQTPPISSSFM